MKYYKAFEQSEKPFITWHEWASDIIELTEMGEYGNPLIVGEDYIPQFIYGICPWKIVAGELVERTQTEMDEYEVLFNKSQFLQQQKELINDVNNGTFTFDSQTFPMDERSRIFYQAMDRARGTGDVKCMTANGQLYNLTNANIDAFLDAYYLQLRTLSQPLV